MLTWWIPLSVIEYNLANFNDTKLQLIYIVNTNEKFAFWNDLDMLASPLSLK